MEDNINLESYPKTPYTITLDWESGEVWLIDNVNKRKYVLTEKESKRIVRNFELIKEFK